MEFAKLGVNLAKSVLVKSDTNTSETDRKLLETLAANFGPIEKTERVDDPMSKHKNLVVEFQDDSALITLEPQLPMVQNMDDEGVVYNITSLANEYAATVGGTHTEKYLKHISDVAISTGKSFESILKDMLLYMSKELKEPSEGEENKMAAASVPKVEQEEPQETGTGNTGNGNTGNGTTRRVTRTVSLSADDLNPPEVKTFVVEHILRKEDFSSHSMSPLKLRAFSGKCPKPSNEADYETWRSQIDLLLADPSLSALHVTRRILESLLSPAAEVIKGLGPEALPTTYLQVLDAAFATVQDGEELFAQFLTTYQNQDEKYSAYLQRLQLTLNTVVKRGGIQSAEAEKHLIRQFSRGCLENAVITNLLEQKKEHPPSFSELLVLLRTEEDRQLAKETRMKKQSSTSKKHVNLSSHSACACGASELDSNAIKDLQKQMTELQDQLTSLLSQKKTRATSSKFKPSASAVPQSSTRPKPWYCFKCGEDGHIITSCSNAANPTLVMEKKKQLQQKQQTWDMKNKTNASN